jgi:hypothetical protein
MGNIIKREFNGFEISFIGKEEVSLTDLWKASGSIENKDPRQWQRKSGEEFVVDLAESLNVPVEHIIKSKRGKSGGTWAHWQIGLAYAQYLSTSLHRFVNQCFMDYVAEANNPSLKMERAIDGYRRKGKDDAWIDARFKSKLTTRMRNNILATRQGGEGNIYAMCNNATNKAIFQMTADEYRKSKGLTKSAAIRDNLTTKQLLEIMLTEEVSAERIIELNIVGNINCAQVHEVIGTRVHNAVTMRGI